MRSARLIASLAIVVLLAGPAVAQTVGIGTSAQGSITYSIGATLAKIITTEVGVQSRVQPRGGNSVVVPAVNAGEVDFGVSNVVEMADALAGTGIYQGQQLSSLRVVTVLMPTRVGLFVQKDSPIKSIRDLKGKRVPGVWTTMKSVELTVAGLLANGGLGWNDVRIVPVPNVVRGADDFAQGKTDVLFFALGTAKVLEVNAMVGGLRLLPIDPSPDAMARMRKHFPSAYAETLTTSDEHPGVQGPTPVTAFDFLLLTNSRVSDDLIFKVTRALHDGKATMLTSFKELGNLFSPQKMAKNLPVGEYHPGSVKFYREKGLWPPKE